MKLTIYHLKACDTCRKAIKALGAAGHELEPIDVRADGVAPSTLARLEKSVGWKALLNTRSTTWRGLDEAERAGDAQALLIANPTLIKRPVIEAGNALHIGWGKDVQAVFG